MELVCIITSLLITLWRIANRISKDPAHDADTAFRRGVEALDEYYKGRDQ